MPWLLLQEKVKQFRKEFDEGDPELTASAGWLDCCKK